MREAIAQIISELDHPDSDIRRQLLDQLVDFGPEGIDAISANLGLVAPKIKFLLVQVLHEIGSRAAVLPLMRFVFDNRNDATVSDARGLSMRVVADLGHPSQAQQLFDFALDLVDDNDVFVRAGACAIIGRFGDRRAEGILKDRLDDDEVVVEAAQRALLRLKTDEQPGLKANFTDNELVQQIRTESGGHRAFLIEELKRRENAFELAAELASIQGRGMMAGLTVIAELDDPRGRRVAHHVLDRAVDATSLAVALRLLAQHLNGDADEEEVAAIRQRYYHDDRFVQLAALGAAAKSGDHDLLQRAVSELLRTRDEESQHLILVGLSKTLPERSRWAFPKLREFVLGVRVRKSTDANRTLYAYALRAVRRAIGSTGVGVHESQALAFQALEDANGFFPIVVTALELLEKTTPEPLPLTARWGESETMSLANCLEDGNAKTDIIVLRLLHAGAPDHLDQLVRPLKPLTYSGPEALSYVIPLLGQIGSADAMRTLDELAEDADPEVRAAAESAKRKRRNRSDFIDAEFE